MKRKIIALIIILTLIFNIIIVLKCLGIVTLCTWILTIPYLLLLLVFVLYYDLSNRLSLREFATYMYLVVIFLVGFIAVVLLIGDQPIEEGFYKSYSGAIWNTDKCNCN